MIKLAQGKKKSQTAYVPTPEEIAEACAEIQSTWSRRERSKRAGVNPRITALVPDYSMAELGLLRRQRSADV